MTRTKNDFVLTATDSVSNQHTYTWLARKVNGPPKRRTRQRQLFQHVFLTFVYVSVEIKENFFKIKTNNAIKGE